MGVEHPDYTREYEHLLETLKIIETENRHLQERIADQKENLARLRKVAADEYAELMIRELVHHRTRRMLRELELAQLRAYFTRIDFIPDETGAPEIYYIGKYGILRSDTLEVAVVDWRSPVANLYYSGQVGRVFYEAPDGTVAGEMTLKRMIEARGCAIESIFDTDVATRDVHLQSILGSVSGSRLREIVTTIQTEQNNIIRHDPEGHLIVQGVAGSGKTTIALHRIAYLLYVRRESLTPANLMILAPNPLFLDYISAVLPDLGVEEVMQMTFAALAHRITGGRVPMPLPDRALDGIACDPEALTLATALGATKGGAEFFAYVARWLDAYEPTVIPAGEVKFGPVVIWSAEALASFFLHDLHNFPIERRIAEICKSLKHRIKSAVATVRELIMADAERRAAQLRILSIPDAEKRARMQVLYDSRDGRLKEAKDAAAPFIRQQAARWPAMNPLAAYRRLWEDLEPEAMSAPEVWRAARTHTLAVLDKNRAEAGDIAPLVAIARKLCGLESVDLRAIVIDEAQDVPVFTLMLLRELYRAPMTLVGDLAQGIHAYAGLKNWDDAQRALAGEDASGAEVPILTLRTSYRSTVEIIGAANPVACRYALPGHTPAIPVLRHGPKPDWTQTRPTARTRTIALRVGAWRGEGFHSICVMEKTRDRAKKLYKELEALCAGARLLRPEEADYAAGLWVASVTDVKGLEFDCVLLAEVGASLWRDTPLEARLLYVGMTRPLHRLCGIYTGARTSLLDALPS